MKNGATRFTSAEAGAYTLEAITQPGAPVAFWAQGADAGCVLATATSDVPCGGNSCGGCFHDANDSSYAYSGDSVYGTQSTAWGSTGTGIFASARQYGLNTSASGASGMGLYASGVAAAHFVQSNLPCPYTNIGYSGYGLCTRSCKDIHAYDYDGGGYSRIGSAHRTFNLPDVHVREGLSRISHRPRARGVELALGRDRRCDRESGWAILGAPGQVRNGTACRLA